MGSLGPWEIALIVLAVLLVFGPKQLPKIGRALGGSVKEFKDSVGEPAKEIKQALDTPRELRAALDPRKQLKDAINPFAEEEPEEGEILEGEIVETSAEQPRASAPAPAGETSPEPGEPAAERAERV